MMPGITITRGQLTAQSMLPFFLALTVFAIPISSTAKSVFLFLSVSSIVFSPVYRQDLLNTLNKPWCKAALSLFFVAFVACFWSRASHHDQMLVIEKYSKLLYLPILAVGFQNKRTRSLAIHAFLLAMTITCTLSILKLAGFVKYHGDDPGHVFRNHIMTGYMMAFASYLSALLFVRARGKHRALYAVLCLFFSYQIWFVNTGRTGYVIYALLMMLLILQILSWRQAILAGILGFAALTMLYYENADLHARVAQVAADWQHYQQDNKDTSIGYRLQFHEFARELFSRRPWFGNGTGGFTYSFAKEKPVPSWDRKLLEPHSQYWLIASEFGIAGLVLLGFFFGSLFFSAFRLKTMGVIAIAVLLPFMAGNLSDSLLFYSGTGYFFILFMALCLGESIRCNPPYNCSSQN